MEELSWLGVVAGDDAGGEVGVDAGDDTGGDAGDDPGADADNDAGRDSGDDAGDDDTGGGAMTVWAASWTGGSWSGRGNWQAGAY